jgi:hypothetical protein
VQFRISLLALSCFAFAQAASPEEYSLASSGNLTWNIPPRSEHARTGSQFAAYIAKMDPSQREHAVLNELLAGNLPSFLRHLVPVQLDSASSGAKVVNATVFVMPEYLAIGSDKDYLRIPMNLYTAAKIATRFGFVLPTRKIVDAIYQQSAYHVAPEPMKAGPQMRSTDYYVTHNKKIEEQFHSNGIHPGDLVSGDKKDIVITNMLASKPGQIAIYGWHRHTGAPIQPLSTVHGACYEDYSHGVRLVSQTAVVDGQSRLVQEILKHPLLASLLSDEGAIVNTLQALVSNPSVAQTCSH